MDRILNQALIVITLALFFAVALIYLGCAQIGFPPGSDDLTDDRPPSLAKAEATDQYHVLLKFDEPMDIGSGRDENLYEITGDNGTALAVLDVIPSDTVDTLILVTDKQEKGVKYTVTVRNIRDAEGGNPIGRKNRKSFKGSGKSDEKAPAIVGTYPPDGAEGIGLYPIVTTVFNDAMAPDSFSGETLVVEDDLGRVISGEIEIGVHNISFIPGERLDYSTRYTFIVRDTCTDLAGNILYQERAFTFTTISDTEEITLSGKVAPRGTGIEAGGSEVLLLISPNPEAEDMFVASHTRADDEGGFKLRGIAPNTENVPSYYLLARRDSDGDGIAELSGITDSNGDGMADPLSEMLPGGRLSGSILYLEMADETGPVTAELVYSPSPTNGRKGGYIYARFKDESSNIIGAEAFFDYRGSDGTGLGLNPVSGDWGASTEITADRYVVNLRDFKANRKGEHILYAHGRDGKGNWGDFVEYRFEVTSGDKHAYSISGAVDFDLEPAGGAVVSVWPIASAYPIAVTRSDKKGKFELEGLPPGEYRVEVFGDGDGDSLKGRYEPTATTLQPVSLTSYDYSGLELTLAFAPTISDANARLQYYSTAESRAVLNVNAVVTDRDSDVSRVWAVLPDGSETELMDDGGEYDAARGDGVYSYGIEYSIDEIPALLLGGVALTAEDSFGNITTAGTVGYPGLEITELPPLTGVAAAQTENGIEIKWDEIAGADGGYVAFIVPYDRFERFNEPGTAEVWSNYRNPLFTNEVLVQYKSIEDWWAYPKNAVFYIIIAASAGDGSTYRTSDKSLSIVTIRKKDIKTALPGAGE